MRSAISLPNPTRRRAPARRSRAAGVLLLASLVALVAAVRPAAGDDRELLRKASGKPYVFILLDTSGSMHWSPKCTAADAAAGNCDFICPTGDCFTRLNGDDPASKLYQAKEALYDVIEAVDNVDFGFATYNQDQLRVGHKHWLYRARSNGVDLGSGAYLPVPGAPEVFGEEWNCGYGYGGDYRIGCADSTPANLSDPWELDRVRRLPKGGDNFKQDQSFYVSTGGTTFEIVYHPVSGALGDASVDVQVTAYRCTGGRFGGCTQNAGSQLVTFDRVQQFISWDNVAARTSPQPGYFYQGDASDASATATCNGWEGNADTNADTYCSRRNGCVDLKLATQNLGGSPLLDRGDMVPLSWTSDNRDRILARLAPNRALGESIPDFTVSRYLTDHPGPSGALDVKDDAARPLIATGATPLGNSVRDFRTWYAGCAQGACPNSTGWKDLAAASDPDWGCRQTYLLVITDGDDTCGGADACSATASLYSQESVKTYVVAFGVENTAGNRLNCMAANGGSGNPIYPQNKQQLVDALTQIFSEISEDARSFASAAVPAVQAAVQDKIYLSQFTPLNRSPIWDGHLDAFLEPLPLVQSGRDAGKPDRSKRCSGALLSGCLVWDAGEQLLAQAQGVDFTTDPPQYGMGTGQLERRVFYGQATAPGMVPEARRLWVPPADPSDPSNPATFSADWLDLLSGFGISPVTPGAIDKTKTTIQYVLEPKTVLAKNPDSNTPPEINIDVLLGDIFHSSPVAVGSPDNLVYFLHDVGAKTVTVAGQPSEVGGYQAFALRNRVRRKMILVGADDGQLHVFDAGRYSATVDNLTRSDPKYFSCVDDQGQQVTPVPVIASESFDNGTGHELFSFVPRGSMDELPKLPGSTTQRYTVDNSVTVADANIGPENVITRPDGSEYRSSWRTVAIGGLRRGGRSYYALDVTQPDPITETSICTADGVERATSIAAPAGDGYVPACLGDLSTGAPPAAGCGPRAFPTILWELKDAWDENLDGFPDLGETWSTPVVGRIRVCDGSDCDPTSPTNSIQDRWVAIFGGGFDPDAAFTGPGAGTFLYMVDVATGEILYKAELSGMAPSDPAVVDADQDGYLDRVYIGTTAGHLYKVDMRTVPKLRDVQVPQGGGLPMATVHRISTADSADPAWRPFEIFDTGGRPIFYPPSAIYVSDVSRFAVAFGTGDRDNLWSNDPQAGRFYVFLDNDFTRNTAGLPVTVAALQQIQVDDLNLTMTDNLLLPSGAQVTAGWYLELDPQERLITKPFALSGVLFFTSYQPDLSTSGGSTGNNGQGGGRNDAPVCARTGTSRVFVVFATNANALADVDGIKSRYRPVAEFVTDPFTTPSSTKNAPVDGTGGGDGGTPGHADDLCRNLDQLSQQLQLLFPESCRFATYTLDIQTIRSDRGLVCIAPVPVCFQQQNWSQN